MKIFIVVGSTGEYSDYSEWNVLGFVDKLKADEMIKKLNNIIDTTVGRGEIERRLKEIDPVAFIDYTGISYRIDELEVI